MAAKNFIFYSSNKSFSNNRFSFIVCWIHFDIIYFQKIFKTFIIKFTTLINPYFIWFLFFWNYFFKWSSYTSSFLSFIGTTQSYLLKKSIAHNKYLIPPLYLHNDSISAKSTPKYYLEMMNKLFFFWIL